MNESEQKMYDALYQENMSLKDQLERKDDVIGEMSGVIEEKEKRYRKAISIMKQIIDLF